MWVSADTSNGLVGYEDQDATSDGHGVRLVNAEYFCRHIGEPFDGVMVADLTIDQYEKLDAEFGISK